MEHINKTCMYLGTQVSFLIPHPHTQSKDKNVQSYFWI